MAAYSKDKTYTPCGGIIRPMTKMDHERLTRRDRMQRQGTDGTVPFTGHAIDEPRPPKNKYPGKCITCGEQVEAQRGYIERVGNKWYCQHWRCR